MAADFDIFTNLFKDFDTSVADTIAHGSSAMITLITPLVGAGFTLYVMLIGISWLRGQSDHLLVDLFQRFVAWTAVLLFGLNISYYSNYVVPFVNGMPDQMATVINSSATPATTLDTIGGKFVDGIKDLIERADGIQETFWAICLSIVILFFSMPFMAIAAGYLILAKLSLVLLLAIGPLFISMALFPATRPFFQAWTAQCANYIFLSLLFAFTANIMVSFMGTVLVSSWGIVAVAKLMVVGVMFILISLNLPGLASALAGGVGISSMVGKVAPAASAAYKGLSRLRGGGGKGGQIGSN